MQKSAGGSGGLRCAVAALLGLLGLGALVLLGGAAWALTHLPDPSAEMPAALNPAQVMVIQPANGQSVTLDETLPVYARAFGGQPVQDVELYVDGKRLGGHQADFPAGATKVTAAWIWKPEEAGAHVLTARVRTQGGGGNVSNPVTVNALAADAFPSFTDLAGTGSETTPEEVEDITAVIDAGEPAEAPAGGGGAGEAPEPEEPETIPPPGQQPGGGFLPIGIKWWIGQKLGWMVPASAPEAPQINGLAQDCNGMLVVKDSADNEAGFFLYRLDPGKFVFERIATLDAKQGAQVFSYADAGLASGTYFYYLAAFNLKGETPSNVVSLQVAGPVCDAALPPIFEPESIPVDAAQPTDKAYCYGSADGMPWVRLPAGQSNFMEPLNGKYDLAPYWDQIPLPKPLPPKFLLNMECWGWSGDTLVYLGASSKEFIAEKEAKEPQQGEPEPSEIPDGKGGGGKISPPYNLHISKNFAECAAHTSGEPASQAACEAILGNENDVPHVLQAKRVLMWDWGQYGDCDPETEAGCDMSLLPIDHFQVGRWREGGYEVWSTPSDQGKTTYSALGDAKPGDDFAVCAYNDPIGCSDWSNHVTIGEGYEIVLTPLAKGEQVHGIRNTLVNGVVQNPPYYDGIGELLKPTGPIRAGYEKEPFLNNSLQTVTWYAWFQYNMPQHVYVHSAKLTWDWAKWKGAGPGQAHLSSACGVKVMTSYYGLPVISGKTWSDEAEYDVTGWITYQMMDNLKFANFYLFHDHEWTDEVYPNTCYVEMNNIRLTMLVSDVK